MFDLVALPRAWTKPCLALLACLLLTSCASYPPLKGITESIDADRFAGEWYVIANIPYFAERNKVGSKTIYVRQGPQQFEDIFVSRDGSFEQKPKRLVGKLRTLNEQNTQMQSTFYKVIKSKFQVLYMDENYELMLLGHKSRRYAWIMARTKTITDLQHAFALNVFKINGYDPAKILKVPQLPEQINQAGFQTVK